MMMKERFLTPFLFGCSIGALLTIIYIEVRDSATLTRPQSSRFNRVAVSEDDHHHDDHLPLPTAGRSQSFVPILFNDLNSGHHNSPSFLAKKLVKKVRILCWVMTNPKTLYTKGIAVRDTWGKRCNTLLFFSSVEDKKFPAIGLDVPEGRKYLFSKTRAAWKYVYDNHYDNADWFMKVDDDTYVIVENLRYFLVQYQTTDSHYFGRHFVPFGGYNSGGAGYVFSKQTLRAFTRVMKDPTRCKLNLHSEDVQVGKCLAAEGIHPGDSRDEFGRETFHPFLPETHLIPGTIKKGGWIHKYNKWEVRSGAECCSDHSIAFHYVGPKRMYVLEYLIYHLHAYGVDVIE